MKLSLCTEAMPDGEIRILYANLGFDLIMGEGSMSKEYERNEWALRRISF
jgi:hypothetical protein